MRAHTRPPPYLSAHRGDTSVFLSLVCIIMASQRALLVVYLVSLVNVRSAKCLGREEVGRGDGTGRDAPLWAQTPKLPYIHGDPGANSAPNPQQGRAEPGTNTLLFKQLFKKRFQKKRKQLL